jgi:hypothetical protein
MLERIFGGEPTSEDLIRTQPLKITRRTTGTAGLIALAGVVAAVLNEIDSVGLNLSEYGIVIVIAAGLIAAALASVGDALARAYAQAHVAQPTVPPVQVGAYEVTQENGDIRIHHILPTTTF